MSYFKTFLIHPPSMCFVIKHILSFRSSTVYRLGQWCTLIDDSVTTDQNVDALKLEPCTVHRRERGLRQKLCTIQREPFWRASGIVLGVNGIRFLSTMRCKALTKPNTCTFISLTTLWRIWYCLDCGYSRILNQFHESGLGFTPRKFAMERSNFKQLSCQIWLLDVEIGMSHGVCTHATFYWSIQDHNVSFHERQAKNASLPSNASLFPLKIGRFLFWKA